MGRQFGGPPMTRIRFTQDHIGRHKEGDVLELPEHEAGGLIQAGLAVQHDDPADDGEIEEATDSSREKATSRRRR